MIWALHGAVGSVLDWREFADSVSKQGQQLRRIDLWKFLECCPMPLENFGASLASEIVRVDPEPVLVGYSMGGRLALHALLAQPVLWKAAIIVSAHPGLSDELERVERRAKDAEWSALALKGEWSEFIQKWQSQTVLKGVEMPERSSLKNRRVAISRSFVDWSLGVQSDLRSRLSEITCPVLWLTGEHDMKFTSLAREAVPKLPNFEHRTIAQSGHRLPWEIPHFFSKVCCEFLNQLETST